MLDINRPGEGLIDGVPLWGYGDLGKSLPNPAILTHQTVASLAAASDHAEAGIQVPLG